MALIRVTVKLLVLLEKSLKDASEAMPNAASTTSFSVPPFVNFPNALSKSGLLNFGGAGPTDIDG